MRPYDAHHCLRLLATGALTLLAGGIIAGCAATAPAAPTATAAPKTEVATVAPAAPTEPTADRCRA